MMKLKLTTLLISSYLLHQTLSQTSCSLTQCTSCTGTICNGCRDGYKETVNSVSGGVMCSQCTVSGCRRCQTRINDCDECNFGLSINRGATFTTCSASTSTATNLNNVGTNTGNMNVQAGGNVDLGSTGWAIIAFVVCTFFGISGSCFYCVFKK